MKIAILGSNDRAALTVVRKLSLEETVESIVIIRNKIDKSLSCVSKHTLKSTYFNFGEGDASDLIKLLHHEGIDLILPINDITSMFVTEYYHELVKEFTVLSPEPKSYLSAIDKWDIQFLCDGSNLRFPESKLISEVDDNSNDVPPKKYTYFKTRTSVVSKENSYIKYNVKKIENENGKIRYVEEHVGATDVIAQVALDGSGVGINVLSNQGRVISVTRNERLHQPKGGGGSSYRESSEQISEKLLAIAEAIANELNWTGVMMIELMETDKGYYLIEINPRFWGSLALTEFSGGNYVRNYYRQSIGLKLLHSTLSKVRARHLINDVKWTLRNPSLGNVLNILYSPINVYKGKELYDVEQIGDIKPSIYQIFIIWRTVWRKLFSYI